MNNIQFSEEWKGGGGQQRGRRTERWRQTLCGCPHPAQSSVPHRSPARENIRKKIFLNLWNKKYSESNLYSEKFATKQTLWEEKMTDVTVTFWLEGVLLPIISVFGLIGEGNLMTKKSFHHDFTFAWQTCNYFLRKDP